ncbi:MAG TPA: response regulator, partial [Polyangiales bacterium]
AAPGPATRAGRRAGAHALRGRTILLVEDHEETREAMQFVLERAGSRVVAADSGARALKVLGVDPDLSQHRGPMVDAIVCDLGMPDMSGYEFIARVVEAYQHKRRSLPPACAISAHARDVDRRRAIEAGFDLHLAKPVTAKGLIEAVDDLCQLARAECADSSTPHSPRDAHA